MQSDLCGHKHDLNSKTVYVVYNNVAVGEIRKIKFKKKIPFSRYECGHSDKMDGITTREPGALK